jgi:hypothetical protein
MMCLGGLNFMVRVNALYSYRSGKPRELAGGILEIDSVSDRI